MRQLYWREFSWHLTYHCPPLETEPLRPEFRAFPWEPDDGALRVLTFIVVPVMLVITHIFTQQARLAYRTTRSTVAAVVGDLARSIRFGWFDQPAVDNERRSVLAGVAGVMVFVALVSAALARMMSDYRPDSELKRLEGNTDWTPVSPDLLEVLTTAIHVARATDASTAAGG